MNHKLGSSLARASLVALATISALACDGPDHDDVTETDDGELRRGHIDEVEVTTVHEYCREGPERFYVDFSDGAFRGSACNPLQGWVRPVARVLRREDLDVIQAAAVQAMRSQQAAPCTANARPVSMRVARGERIDNHEDCIPKREPCSSDHRAGEPDCRDAKEAEANRRLVGAEALVDLLRRASYETFPRPSEGGQRGPARRPTGESAPSWYPLPTDPE